MKYLAHLRPPRDVSADIVSFRGAIRDTKTAPNVVHCTLMAGYFPESAEDVIRSELERISQVYDAFECEARGLDFYDKHSVVVRLARTPEIRMLHDKVVGELVQHVDRREQGIRCASCWGEDAREAAHRNFGNCYYGPFYSPHVTVGRSNPGGDLDYVMNMCRDLFTGRTWPAEEIYLSRKPNGKWETVASFRLRR
ncbi:2'-5' RNA ligase family protein [Candidatus Woesearchaeota archaeon]|nr:2'-5' RNA ligase family protein [Candidatus Woesearchaeota archaeon]